MITNERFISWMNVVRNNSGSVQYRILESFWESQITSKQWIIDVLKHQNIQWSGTVYIFGGWFGVLGGMLKDEFPNFSDICSIDINPDVEKIGKKMNPDIRFVTSDMKDFCYTETPSLIINTSTEHIEQDVFDVWMKNIPKFVPVVLQGNNFFECVEHVRCSKNINDFKKMNFMDSTKYAGELDCKQFTRYMTIGYKT